MVDYPADMDNLKLTEILRDLIEKVGSDQAGPQQDDPTPTIGLREALNKKKELPP